MLYPLIMCTMAGLFTAVGGMIAAVKGGVEKGQMSFFQGFAAGVMLAVSFLELAADSYVHYFAYMSRQNAFKAVAALFCTGWVMAAAFGYFVAGGRKEEQNTQILVKRTGLLTAAVITAHNLPEGILTMLTGAGDIKLGLKLSAAVAAHNLPEGMAVAAPAMYLTRSRKKAVALAFWAGMSEPLGGILGWILLKDFITPSLLNGIMPVIAGIMSQTALMELIPAAVKISNIKHTIYGIIGGVLTMCIGLFIF